MPFVKMPGTDREIWLDLHEPTGPETPWFVDAGTEVKLLPEQITAELANPNSEWVFSPPALEMVPVGKHTELEISARKFQKSRGSKGRPFAHTFSRAEDFAVTVLIFEGLGYRQSTRHARLYWEKHGQSCPTTRQIEQALKVVRGWLLTDLNRADQSIRKKYRLTGRIQKNKKQPI